MVDCRELCEQSLSVRIEVENSKELKSSGPDAVSALEVLEMIIRSS